MNEPEKQREQLRSKNKPTQQERPKYSEPRGSATLEASKTLRRKSKTTAKRGTERSLEPT